MSALQTFVPLSVLLAIGFFIMASTTQTTFSQELIEQHPVYTDAPSKDFMKKWLVCGPFPVSASITVTPSSDPSSEKNMVLGIAEEVEGSAYRSLSPSNSLNMYRSFEYDYLYEHGGERSIQPTFGMTHTFQGKQLVWDYIESEADKIDFKNILGDQNHVIVYAYAEVRLDEPKTLILSYGTDDSDKVWVNGQLVHERFGGRAAIMDDTMIELSLNEGTNRILFKVQNDLYDWMLICRLIDQRIKEEISPVFNPRRQHESFQEVLKKNPGIFLMPIFVFAIVIVILFSVLKNRFDL